MRKRRVHSACLGVKQGYGGTAALSISFPGTLVISFYLPVSLPSVRGHLAIVFDGHY